MTPFFDLNNIEIQIITGPNYREVDNLPLPDFSNDTLGAKERKILFQKD